LYVCVSYKAGYYSNEHKAHDTIQIQCL
jgi:hypothetical protein